MRKLAQRACKLRLLRRLLVDPLAHDLLFGAHLALSFTPTEGKQLPFLNAGPHLPGRQADIWEAALRYETEVGPVSLSAYAALAEGRAEHKLSGQDPNCGCKL